jgi:hypothetical protein
MRVDGEDIVAVENRSVFIIHIPGAGLVRSNGRSRSRISLRGGWNEQLGKGRTVYKGQVG